MRPAQRAGPPASTPPAAVAGELAAVVRFLREASGFESLGIGYAALYLKVAPAERRAQPEWAEVLAALGDMAERLGRRASGTTGGRSADAVLAGQVAVAESYGVVFRRFERAARTVVCYDGDAHARVLQQTAAPAELRARAALALTRRSCLDPTLSVAQRRAWNDAPTRDPRRRSTARSRPAGPSRAWPPTACACAAPTPSPTRPTTRRPRVARRPRPPRRPNRCAG